MVNRSTVTVNLKQVATYDSTSVRDAVFQLLSSFPIDKPLAGKRVLIKPNLLMPGKPHHAILTHPMVVRSVVEFVVENGGMAKIMDSPARGSFRKIITDGGYEQALKGLPVTWEPFKASVPVDIGHPFGKIPIAKDVMTADWVINLPKLKTHAQMTLTLGVKNLFGCIIGMEKPQWHLKAGIDRDMFAHLLVSIYRAIHPDITLMDGIVGLEGQGPGKSGNPKQMGLLAASTNAPALDKVICELVGIDPKLFPTHRAAEALNMVPQSIEVVGDFKPITDFLLPTSTPLPFGPRYFQKLVRQHMIQRPVVKPEICKLCGECWTYCPASAIDQTGKTIRFDTEACIRCYCCIEVCPHGALVAKEPALGKFYRRLSSMIGR